MKYSYLPLCLVRYAEQNLKPVGLSTCMLLLVCRMLDHFPPDVLPRFTPEDQQLLIASVQYQGINVYTSRYIAAGAADDMVGCLSNCQHLFLLPMCSSWC